MTAQCRERLIYNGVDLKANISEGNKKFGADNAYFSDSHPAISVIPTQ